MRDDYRVPALDLLEIWRLAKAQRHRLVRRDAVRVDPLSLSDAGELWTVGGPRLEFVAEADLPDDAGQTTYEDGQIHIRLPEHVRHQALIGDGDARFAVARELGRATIYPEALTPRVRKQASLVEQFVQVRPTGTRSAAWQADTFAAAFLIHDETAWQLKSLEDVSIEVGVGLFRARLYYSQMAWALIVLVAAFSISAAQPAAAESWLLKRMPVVAASAIVRPLCCPDHSLPATSCWPALPGIVGSLVRKQKPAGDGGVFCEKVGRASRERVHRVKLVP